MEWVDYWNLWFNPLIEYYQTNLLHLDKDADWTVECMKKAKGEGKQRRYMVSWEGYEKWVPAAQLHPTLVTEFEAYAHTSDDGDQERRVQKQRPGRPRKRKREVAMNENAVRQLAHEERLELIPNETSMSGFEGVQR